MSTLIYQLVTKSYACAKTLMLEMKTKCNFFACNVPTPFPSQHRQRLLPAPLWICPLLFVEAAFINDDETYCPNLYCPLPPFQANMGRYYYLSTLVCRSCIWKWWWNALSRPVLSPPPSLPSQHGQRLLPVHSCLQKLHLEMMMKRIVPACTVPNAPFPANRSRNYYLPSLIMSTLFVEAAFGYDD